MMFPDEMSQLLDAHIQCQTGCYISEVIEGAAHDRYVLAAQIPDTGWNFCIPAAGSRSNIEWGIRQARSHGREAAFLVPQGTTLDLGRASVAAQEHWMLRPPAAPVPTLERPSVITRLVVIEGADPGADFGHVFSRLFNDADSNAHFERYYVPTLRAATAPAKAKPLHLVAYVGAEPVGCASVYLIGDFAGLYNVGAVAARQMNGIGAWISAEALKQTDARSVFLQCEVGTHVERLYRGLGFTDLATPEIITVNDANG